MTPFTILAFRFLWVLWTVNFLSRFISFTHPIMFNKNSQFSLAGSSAVLRKYSAEKRNAVQKKGNTVQFFYFLNLHENRFGYKKASSCWCYFTKHWVGKIFSHVDILMYIINISNRMISRERTSGIWGLWGLTRNHAITHINR